MSRRAFLASLKLAGARNSATLLALVGFFPGCGGSDDAHTIHDQVMLNVSAPSPVNLQTCSASASLSALAAKLIVGGHEGLDCTMTVNPATLAATGTCGPITTRRFRYVLVIYSLPEPALPANVVPLADLIGWVDLTTNALKPGDTVVNVAMTADGINSALITTQAQLDALATVADTSELTRQQATAYARVLKPFAETNDLYGATGQRLDCAPGGSNLAGACNDLIFSTSVASCHKP